MAHVTLRDISVDIPVFDASSRSLKNNMLAAATGGQIAPREGRGKVIVRAIQGLSVHFEHGARVGLVGHNGAGKSTLLRVIAGIYEPTAGRVETVGEIAAMFDLGFGMDADSTGWENIVLRGMLLGQKRSEIEAKLPEIGALTGLGDFLDMPIRTYSAGMSARLAFAVSTAMTPEILLVDEGIGAGDAAFLEQAEARLETYIGDAGVLVMASHADALLRRWCTTGLWMEHGCPRMYGPIDAVLDAYAASI